MTTAGRPSTTAPKKMKTTAVIARNVRLLPGTIVMSPISIAGSCWMVRNHEITPAVASSSPTAPVTAQDWMRISGSADQAISRYTKSPTTAA